MKNYRIYSHYKGSLQKLHYRWKNKLKIRHDYDLFTDAISTVSLLTKFDSKTQYVIVDYITGKILYIS